jgi:hypothetical protein
MAVTDKATPPFVVLEDDDEMTPAEREHLRAALERGLEEARQGEGMSWEATMAWLRARRETLRRR